MGFAIEACQVRLLKRCRFDELNDSFEPQEDRFTPVFALFAIRYGKVEPSAAQGGGSHFSKLTAHKLYIASGYTAAKDEVKHMRPSVERGSTIFPIRGAW